MLARREDDIRSAEAAGKRPTVLTAAACNLGNLPGELVLIGLTVWFALLARLAFNSRRRWTKWGGAVLAGIPLLLFGLPCVVIGNGLYKAYAPRTSVRTCVEFTWRPYATRSPLHVPVVGTRSL